jgi:hypothetical protein
VRRVEVELLPRELVAVLQHRREQRALAREVVQETRLAHPDPVGDVAQ